MCFPAFLNKMIDASYRNALQCQAQSWNLLWERLRQEDHDSEAAWTTQGDPHLKKSSKEAISEGMYLIIMIPPKVPDARSLPCYSLALQSSSFVNLIYYENSRMKWQLAGKNRQAD